MRTLNGPNKHASGPELVPWAGFHSMDHGALPEESGYGQIPTVLGSFTFCGCLAAAWLSITLTLIPRPLGREGEPSTTSPLAKTNKKQPGSQDLMN